MNHLRATVYTSYIKDVYEEVTHYLKTILTQASQKGFDAGRLIGEHSFKVDARVVLAMGNWQNICAAVADSVFQSLEAEKSTLSLIDKMSKKLDLNVDQALVTAALPYLEVRHFLVHADGKITPEFCAKYPHIRVESHYVTLSYQFITAFRKAVHDLVKNFDDKVVAKAILDKNDVQP